MSRRACRTLSEDASGSRGRKDDGNKSRRAASSFPYVPHYASATPNGSRRPTGREVHAVAAAQAARTLYLGFRSFGFLRFTPERFHVLLNSLFKVLFNFPSRYLFAIGLVVVFSLRWSLPPT